jgi:hypothetical protein
MKCRNCGYSNSSERTSCVKCNTPLDSREEASVVKAPARSEEQEQIAKTIMGKQPVEPFIDRPVHGQAHQPLNGAAPAASACPQCAYPVLPASTFCPNCNAELKASDVQANLVNRVQRNEKAVAGTIDPFRRQGFSLRPIVNGVPSSTVYEFTDNSVRLNRSNTLQDNMTITSKTQAEIANRDGVWTIVDHSEAKTTFVQAGEPKEIRKGDIIVMGDTKFIFE